MKRILICLTVLVMIALFTSQALSDVKVESSGQVRLRCEFDNDPQNVFAENAATVHTTYLRTRFNINALVNENASAYIQFQDSRKFGTLNSGGIGVDADDKVYLHQAYLKVNHLWENGIGIKAGRFEVNLGNQRVFGAVGWHNFGRTWDGMELFYSGGKCAVSGYYLRPRDDFNASAYTDFDIFGLNAKINSINLELFAFMEYDALLKAGFTTYDSTDTSIDTTDYLNSTHKNLQRINIGMYYTRDYNQFDFSLNAVYQMGKIQDWTGVNAAADTMESTELDIAAYMATFEAGYTFDGDMKPRIALGIDYTSGDDGSDATKHKTYNNLYYTGHKFRGYMDYFLASNSAGLMDLMFRGKISPIEGWTVKGDFHLFTTAEDYTSNVTGDNSKTKDIGMEFDFSVATGRILGATWVGGVSLFMPKKAYTGGNDNMTMWAYSMFIVGF